MNTLLLKLAVTTAVICLLTSNPKAAQVSPTNPRAARVQITKGPEIEMTKEFLTIIRCNPTNPGGSPENYPGGRRNQCPGHGGLLGWILFERIRHLHSVRPPGQNRRHHWRQDADLSRFPRNRLWCKLLGDRGSWQDAAVCFGRGT